jgi:glutathionylspermidine synthase
MDRIKKYQKIIINLLKPFKNEPTDTYVLIDKEQRHYQVMRAGWDNQQHYFLRVRMHLHIKPDGKIWIMENRTEEDIAEMLVAQGVPKLDIVLALLPVYARSHSGYGVG